MAETTVARLALAKRASAEMIERKSVFIGTAMYAQEIIGGQISRRNPQRVCVSAERRGHCPLFR